MPPGCGHEVQSGALLLANIAGVVPGFRVFGAPAALSCRRDMSYARVALSLGLAPQLSGLQIVEALAQTRQQPHRKPVLVEEAHAPCQQRILRGDAATFSQICPMCWPGAVRPTMRLPSTSITRR